MSELTLFDRLGGESTIQGVAADFYDRVIADRRLEPFFGQIEMAHQLDQLTAFLIMGLGGPDRYRGRGMREAHAEAVEQGLSDRHFDCVIEHLDAAFASIGAEEKDIAQVQALVAILRQDVLGR